jgi:hypothetical protein
MKSTFFISRVRNSFNTACTIAAMLLFGVLACSAQTGDYLYNGPGTYWTEWEGSEDTITLSPGLYDITAYGAAGGGAHGNGYANDGYANSGGLGAEMEGEFSFSTTVNLTLLVGGAGGFGSGGFTAPDAYYVYDWGGGGGGGSFVVNGNTPLLVAGGGGGGGQSGGGGNGSIYAGSGNGGTGSYGYGGGGGAGYSSNGVAYALSSGLSYLNGGRGGFGTGASYYGEGGSGNGGYGGGGGGVYGGGGGGGYSGGNGGGYFSVGTYETGGFSGDGGGSIIDSSAIAILTEVSGVASPDGSPNGEIIITAVPEPAMLALGGLGGLSLLLFRRKRK